VGADVVGADVVVLILLLWKHIKVRS